MLEPPQYQKVPTIDHQEGQDSIESITYPPALPISPPDLKPVTFTYNPQYPHEGSLQHVVGILGPTYDQTVTTLACYFPSLAEMSAERLSLTLPHAGQSEGGSEHKNEPKKWATLNKDVWPSLVADPPERLGVVLMDLPSEKAQRSRRDCCIVLSVLCSPFLMIGLLIMLGRMLARR